MKLLIRNILYLLLVLAWLMTGSCVGSKKTFDRNAVKNSSEKISEKNDSVRDTRVNQAINDNFTIPLGTADELVNARIREALANFKAGKQSGSNSTSVYFDEDALAFKIANMIGETKDTNTEVNSNKTTERTDEERVIEASKKIFKVIPWWVYAIAIWFLLPRILQTVAIFVPQVGVFLSKKTQS
ncbi:hypothetical protein ACH3O9_11290 [Leeuwenhoekiella sp. A16]|uniref:hypothetical protein n=1 Tax=Leeuwenhoekiella sp. A16 TaxID=3141462 RepID=UPI003A7FD595